MKKFLLFFIGIAFLGFTDKVNAQCAVGEQIIVVKNIDGTNPANCKVTVDIIFDLENNAGNKYVFIHAFRAADYPGYFELAKPGTCQTPANPNPNQPTAPPPVRGTNAQGNLDAAILNIGFNNDVGTGGYLSYITSAQYTPDNGTLMTIGSGLVEKTASPVAGFSRYTMRDVVVFTGAPCGSPLTIKADLWSSQASSLSVAHCWRCNFTYLFNEPQITGLVNCTNPRTVNFQLSTNSTTALSGVYRIYVDNTPFGSFGTEDTQLAPDASGSFSGLTNSSTQFFNNIPYNGNNVGSESTKALWIEAVVTNPVGTQTNSTVKLITNGCNTLPVSLRSFNAVQRGGKASLTWETSLETDNDGFEVQRRLGNGRYETIAFVDSKAPGGNGGAYTYSFDDQLSLPKGVAYYRIRQVDLNGRSSYSEVRALRSGNGQIVVAVYPNPSRGATNVAIPEGAGIMDVSLDDYSGKSIQRWNGINVRNLQLTNLKPGIYMLRINFRESGEQITERILVQ